MLTTALQSFHAYADSELSASGQRDEESTTTGRSTSFQERDVGYRFSLAPPSVRRLSSSVS